MSRLGATFGALIHEQVSAVRRVLDDETSWDQSEPSRWPSFRSGW